MKPTAIALPQDLWQALPLQAQSLAHQHADLAIAHPNAAQWLSERLQQAQLEALPEAPWLHIELAALALGFEPQDAALIAMAWQRQSQREGFCETAWPQQWADFAASAQPHTNHMSTPPKAHAPCPKHMGLYVVAPSAEWIARLVDMGVPTVQLRFKSEDPLAVAREVRQAIAHARQSTSHLYINDHWSLAIEYGAYGVHLGQEDIGQADFAAIAKSGLRLGLSTHGYSEMVQAASLGPSYLALGAVYATNLKVMPTQPQGPKRLARYVALMQDHFSLVAIGGIDHARLDEVLPSGVGSVAAVRAILQAPDPAREVQRWMQRCPARR